MLTTLTGLFPKVVFPFPPSGMTLQSFLHEMAQVMSLINGGVSFDQHEWSACKRPGSPVSWGDG